MDEQPQLSLVFVAPPPQVRLVDLRRRLADHYRTNGRRLTRDEFEHTLQEIVGLATDLGEYERSAA